MKKTKVDFNPKFAKSLGKDKFIKHFDKIYPDIDLAAEYDHLFPQKTKSETEGKENK